MSKKTNTKKKASKKQGPVKSIKVIEDGIQFASKLERFCYITLRDNKVFDKYEGEAFPTLDGFHFHNISIERQANSKGEYKDRGSKKIIGIKYTPDFTSTDYIIEVKGRPNDSFGIRWKLFKAYLNRTGDTRHIYKPQNQKEIIETVELIKKHRKDERAKANSSTK